MTFAGVFSDVWGVSFYGSAQLDTRSETFNDIWHFNVLPYKAISLWEGPHFNLFLT